MKGFGLLNNWVVYICVCVKPRFPKYAGAESRRESATHIREENTSRIHAKPKVT